MPTVFEYTVFIWQTHYRFVIAVSSKQYHVVIASYNCLLGLRFILENFGEEARSRTAWQIDPFGHSSEMATIFALVGTCTRELETIIIHSHTHRWVMMVFSFGETTMTTETIVLRTI